MVNVDINKLKTLLKFDGVDVGDFTDEELLVLIETKVDELEGLTGVNLRPKDKTKITGKFKGKVFELDEYPISQVVDIFINDHPLRRFDYNVNYDLGIIYFRHFVRGSVRVQYSLGVSDDDFEYLIFPLIKDMVAYTISFGMSNRSLRGWGYTASSLKEGDVSVNFSSGATGEGAYGYTGSINNKIDDLKKKYGYRARVRWI